MQYFWNYCFCNFGESVKKWQKPLTFLSQTVYRPGSTVITTFVVVRAKIVLWIANSHTATSFLVKKLKITAF